jgi:glycolate oxidase
VVGGVISHKIVDELRGMVGNDNVLTEEFELLPYTRDHQMVKYSEQFMYKPEVVVLPETSDQVAHIVCLANKERIPVVPRGAGTGMTGNCVPICRGILLDMKKMSRIIEIDKGNMVVTTQSGICLEKLDEELRKHGFICGHDPASFPSATVGGAISTNGLGCRAAKYGPMAQQVVGLKVVLPTGELIKVGGGTSGKVGKTSVGYGALRSLFIGTWGTLGIVTEATLRIFPLPEKVYVTSIAFKDLKSATEAAYNMIMADMPLSLFGIYDKHKIAAARRMDPNYPDENCTMTIGFEGAKEVVEAARKRAIEICKKAGGKDLGPEIGMKDWEGRHDFYPDLTSLGPGMWQDEEGAVPFTHSIDALKQFHEILKKYDIEDWGGEIWTVQPPLVSVLWKVDERNEDKWQDYVNASKEIAEVYMREGGTISTCHGLGTRREEDLMPLELGPEIYEIMKKIKKVIDPNNIMNPGRMGLDDAYKE